MGNPEIDWYHGTVSLDVLPTMNSQNNWKIDFTQLSNRLSYYHSVGIQTLHLRDISKKHPNASSNDQINDKSKDLNNMYHPSNMMTGLIKDMLNDSPDNSLQRLASSLHQLNMTL